MVISQAGGLNLSKTFIKTQTGAMPSPAQVPLGTAQETKNSTREKGWTLRVWEYKPPLLAQGLKKQDKQNELGKELETQQLPSAGMVLGKERGQEHFTSLT